MEEKEDDNWMVMGEGGGRGLLPLRSWGTTSYLDTVEGEGGG